MQAVHSLPQPVQIEKFSFGNPKTVTNSLWGQVYHGEKMPTKWFIKIKDLWIANNSNISASEASAISTAISSNDDLTTYSIIMLTSLITGIW